MLVGKLHHAANLFSAQRPRSDPANAGTPVILDAESQAGQAYDDAVARLLGESVPIAALFDWLQGRPWNGAGHTARVDGTPGFNQLGWRIDLSRHDEGWIEVRRDSPPAIVVRARLERS